MYLYLSLLYFNTSHVNVNLICSTVNVLENVISIHLMLMLIVVQINVLYEDCNISIHLMLMLIGRIAEVEKVRLLNFNTSHVNVNPQRI